MRPDEVKALIVQALPDATVQVEDMTGTGDHFRAVVVSSAFEGKGLVDQHQMVYAPLRERMADQSVHALSLKTMTPVEWAERNP